MKKKEGYFTNLNSGMLVATFFSLWLAVYFENNVENTLAYILILSFGILHGANDIKLLQRSGKEVGKQYSYMRILIYYVVFVLAVAGLFYVLPEIALTFFILFSAYHFGEQHWAHKFSAPQWEQTLLYTTYGLLVLFLLFTAHDKEVTSIIMLITGTALSPDIYTIILGVAGIMFVLLILKKVKQLQSTLLLESFYLLVFFIIFNTASLLWAFAIYFIIWHSIPSLHDQIEYLYGDFNKANFIRYLRSSWAYWVVSVLSLVVLFVFIDDSSVNFLPWLFSFLAAITFPHVLVISRLNRS